MRLFKIFFLDLHDVKMPKMSPNESYFTYYVILDQYNFVNHSTYFLRVYLSRFLIRANVGNNERSDSQLVKSINGNAVYTFEKHQ